MKQLFTILSFTLLWMFTGCGSQQVKGLEAKKAQLKKLKTQQIQLNEQINELETELAELDPSLARQTRTVAVKVDQISAREFKHYIKVQGEVEANQNIIVSPKTAGNILSIHVKEGQQVAANTVLAKIDDAVIKRNIEELKTQLSLTKILFEKQKNLWEQEIGTEVQYLTAKNQMETLQKRLATLEEQADMTIVKAPISGTIDKIFPKIGEAVAPGTPFFRVVNNRNLSLVANIAESYIPHVKQGDAVNIYFSALDKEILTRISSVGQSIDPQSRTFEVEAQLPPSSDFKANMFGEISINDRTINEAVTIPVNVIQRSDQGSFVFVAEKSEDDIWMAKRVNIKTGLSNKGQVVVEEGLKKGDYLITTGYKDLSDGQVLDIQGMPIS